MLLTAYKYFYYRIYAWNLRVWGESDLPQFNSLFGVSFLILMNIITCITAIELFTGNHVTLSRFTVITIGLAILGIGYFFLVHNRNYEKIASEFKDETPAQRKRRLVASFVYVLLSFVSFFWLVSLRNR